MPTRVSGPPGLSPYRVQLCRQRLHPWLAPGCESSDGRGFGSVACSPLMRHAAVGWRGLGWTASVLGWGPVVLASDRRVTFCCGNERQWVTGCYCPDTVRELKWSQKTQKSTQLRKNRNVFFFFIYLSTYYWIGRHVTYGVTHMSHFYALSEVMMRFKQERKDSHKNSDGEESLHRSVMTF